MTLNRLLEILYFSGIIISYLFTLHFGGKINEPFCLESALNLTIKFLI